MISEVNKKSVDKIRKRGVKKNWCYVCSNIACHGHTRVPHKNYKLVQQFVKSFINCPLFYCYTNVDYIISSARHCTWVEGCFNNLLAKSIYSIQTKDKVLLKLTLMLNPLNLFALGCAADDNYNDNLIN